MIKTFLTAFSAVSIPHLAVGIGLIAAVAGAAGLAGGWTINGWRLGAELATVKGERQECRTAAAAVGRTLDTQNQAIAGWRKAAEAAKGRGDLAQRQADALVVRLQPELERLETAIAATAAAGAARSCADAAAEVRKGLRP